MNKSKFKSVNWKHGNTQMHILMENDCKYYWQSDLFPFAGRHGFIKVPEDFIEQYPELFEVEKAEREFEHKAYYKVKISSLSEEFEPAQYDGHTKGFYVINSKEKYLQSQIFEIGKKIEL